MAQAGLAAELIGRWRVAASVWGAPADLVDSEYADLVVRYGEPHRRYHTLEHIGEVLARLERADVEVELAAWFHDVIYDTRASDSEARSASHAAEALERLGAPAATIDEVRRLIELTATHAVDVADAHGAALIDADLSILSADPARYDRYAGDVRAEYAHVDAEQWRSGRTTILRALLANAADERARSNLGRELMSLAAPEP